MAPEDKAKTTFVTPWGTYCYKVMPFGLKNAGATYQRAMVALFHDMMHKEIEVYVDDMIAKSKKGEDHVKVLRKLFERLRKYELKLNPAKCSFGVKSGKLLGFVVSNRGIEVDPDKVRAIQSMPSPKTEKEVRGFLGRMNYIARFIAQLTTTCEPIFRLLRKKNPGTWNEKCRTLASGARRSSIDFGVFVVLLCKRESSPSIMVTRKPNWSFRDSKARDWLRKGKVLAPLVRPT
jgi:hypothetical protein